MLGGVDKPGDFSFVLAWTLPLFVQVSTFILCSLPFAWMASWLFSRINIVKSQPPQPVAKSRVIIAYTWIVVASLLAGGGVYALHYYSVFQPFYATLHEKGGSYYPGIAGVVGGSVIFSTILGVSYLPVLRKYSTASKKLLTYGLLSILAGPAVFAALLIKDARAAQHPNFTVFTPNTAQTTRAEHKGLDYAGPPGVRLLLDDKGSSLLETKTTLSDAYNTQTKSCVPPPYSNHSFKDTYECTYETTTKNGIRIYKSGNNGFRFFVIKDTFFRHQLFTPDISELVDSLVPGTLKGNSVVPVSDAPRPKLTIYTPRGDEIVRTKSFGDLTVEITVLYSSSQGKFGTGITQQYTNQPTPKCLKKPRYPGDGYVCKYVFTTSGKRKVYIDRNSHYTYYLIIGNTNIEIQNYGGTDEEVMNFIDSLQPKDQ